MQTSTNEELTKAMTAPRPDDRRVGELEKLAAQVSGKLWSVAEKVRLHRMWSRRLRTVLFPGRRRQTKVGFSIVHTQKSGESVYAMTSREHAKRRAARKQARSSRRANRG